MENSVIINSPDSITLQGRYDFGGVNSDMGKFYYYNQNVKGNYKAFARVHNNIGASTNGKVILMFSDIANGQKTGGLPIHYISASQGEINLFSRLSKGLRTQNIASVAISAYPCWLYLEKNGSTLIAKYSLQPENTEIQNMNWIELGSVSNAFAGWTNIKKGLGVSSGLETYSSATISNFRTQAL